MRKFIRRLFYIICSITMSVAIGVAIYVWAMPTEQESHISTSFEYYCEALSELLRHESRSIKSSVERGSNTREAARAAYLFPVADQLSKRCE